MVLNLPLCSAYCLPRKTNNCLSVLISSIGSWYKVLLSFPLCIHAIMCKVCWFAWVLLGRGHVVFAFDLLCCGSVDCLEKDLKLERIFPIVRWSHRPGNWKLYRWPLLPVGFDFESIFTPDNRSMRLKSSAIPPSRSSIRSLKKVSPHLYFKVSRSKLYCDKLKYKDLHIPILTYASLAREKALYSQ